MFYLDYIYENINNHLYLQTIGKFIYIIIGEFREITGEKQSMRDPTPLLVLLLLFPTLWSELWEIGTTSVPCVP